MNGLLQPYKPMVSQIRQDNFMSCLRFMLGNINNQRIDILMQKMAHVRGV